MKAPVSNTSDHISFLRREYKTPPMFHPLAGTSINDMMTEFSKFDFKIIAIGYVLMVSILLLLIEYLDKGQNRQLKGENEGPGEGGKGWSGNGRVEGMEG